MNTQYTCPVCGSHTFSKPVCLVKTGTLPKATQGLVPWIVQCQDCMATVSTAVAINNKLYTQQEDKSV